MSDNASGQSSLDLFRISGPASDKERKESAQDPAVELDLPVAEPSTTEHVHKAHVEQCSLGSSHASSVTGSEASSEAKSAVQSAADAARVAAPKPVSRRFARVPGLVITPAYTARPSYGGAADVVPGIYNMHMLESTRLSESQASALEVTPAVPLHVEAQHHTTAMTADHAGGQNHAKSAEVTEPVARTRSCEYTNVRIRECLLAKSNTKSAPFLNTIESG